MQKHIHELSKMLKSQYKAIPIGNEASRSIYVSSYLATVSNYFKNKFTICPEKVISGPNGHGPLDYALVSSTSSKVIGAVEVKATDYIQGIAQNTVQCETLLANGREMGFGIITDAEKWFFLKCFLDNGKPTFQLSKKFVVVYEDNDIEYRVGEVFKTIVWLIKDTGILN
ncbi:hypothetical protein C2G38_2036735 [Gigaspora rosea]|uniref:Uncharacterized protein n=1 Tax=Gigaspora rosea TaxID=44941 RepID=A0A397VH59_9GLOM|nr:hypothetical protein C2G38_2036735 [Gigaspora rosea]